MTGNPVQVVLNTGNFITRPERTPGGSIKDFYCDRDAEFAVHKQQLLGQLGHIRQRIQTTADLGIDYVHVVLQNDAWAKTKRPLERVLPPAKVPLIGGGQLGELLVEITAENLPLVEQAIEKAELTVPIRKNSKDEEVPRPSRNRSEVGAIRAIRSHEASDRRYFSAEDAVRWLADPRTGGIYFVETFVDASDLDVNKPERTRARIALRRFLNELPTNGVPIEIVEPPPRWRGRRFLFLRVQENQVDAQSVARHQQLLEYLDRQPAVRRVLLPPLVETGHTAHGDSKEVATIPPPVEAGTYPVIGIVDTGVSEIDALEKWCAGRTPFVGSANQNRSHGTFIAGLAAAAANLNSHELFTENPCRFYDLALFPTDPVAFQSFYPKGFLDFLEQLAVELSAATAAGARVINMSLALERQVSDDSYGVFAMFIDEIADTQDVLVVLPSGNLTPPLWRSEWPDHPKDALRMLAEYRHSGRDRILQPAESVRSVVAGAVNPPSCATAALRPTVYSRRGPSAALGTKPDVAHVGGQGAAEHHLFSLDVNGHKVDGCGTSYSAPLVAKILANLNTRIEGHVERETLIALLTHHANLPKDLRTKDLVRVAKDFVGFGVPLNSDQMLETPNHSITLLFNGELEPDRELVFPFSWPTSLVNAGGDCRGRVRLTLVYRPPIDARFDAEFVRVNLDAHLRQEHVDPKTGEVSWEGRLRSETDKRYERELIEHGQKWWPVKQYERALKRVGASSQWRLVIEGLARAGTSFPAEGVQFAALLTIQDEQETADVFREMRQGLLAAGAQIADVRTANRVGTRI
jgi:Subtilase family